MVVLAFPLFAIRPVEREVELRLIVFWKQIEVLSTYPGRVDSLSCQVFQLSALQRRRKVSSRRCESYGLCVHGVWGAWAASIRRWSGVDRSYSGLQPPEWNRTPCRPDTSEAGVHIPNAPTIRDSQNRLGRRGACAPPEYLPHPRSVRAADRWRLRTSPWHAEAGGNPAPRQTRSVRAHRSAVARLGLGPSSYKDRLRASGHSRRGCSGPARTRGSLRLEYRIHHPQALDD